jgi:hypothetical protein
MTPNPHMAVVFQRNSRIESAPFDKESILFNPDTKQFVKLNHTTAIIWERLRNGATADEVAAELCEKFNGIVAEQAKADANVALEEMSGLGLINKG